MGLPGGASFANGTQRCQSLLTASQSAVYRWSDHSMGTEVIQAFSQYQRAQNLAKTTGLMHV